jgi:hypothetical protein
MLGLERSRFDQNNPSAGSMAWPDRIVKDA